MSLISWQELNKEGYPVGPVWFVAFDSLIMEEVARAAEISTYPVETGAILSDHYQPQPRQLMLTGIISDTPTSEWTNIQEGLNKRAKSSSPKMAVRPLSLSDKIPPPQRGPAGIARPLSTGVLPSRRLIRANVERATLRVPRFAQTLQVVPGGTVDRVTTFMAALDSFVEDRQPVSILTSMGTEYQDMMIADYRAPRRSGSSGGITITIEAQQIIKADPVETAAAAQQRAEPKNKPQKKGGTRGKRAPNARERKMIERIQNQGNLGGVLSDLIPVT